MSEPIQSSSFGGLKVRNDAGISRALFCEHCRHLPLVPVQLRCCGTRLCRWCAQQGLPDSEPFICSFCQVQQPNKQILPDRGVELEMNALHVECHACPWNGLFKDYRDHLSAHHADLKCPDCHQCFFAINLYEEHRELICEERRVGCGVPDCMELVKRRDLESHYGSEEHQLRLNSFVKHAVLDRDYHVQSSSNDLSNVSTSASTIEEESLAVMRSTVNNGLGAASILTNEVPRIRSGQEQIQSTKIQIVSQVHQKQKDLRETASKISELQQLEGEAEKKLDNLRSRAALKTPQLLNDDGSIIFPLTELGSPFSIIFKTGDHGYHFTLRVCTTVNPNNPSEAYLSIFISLLRGDYDPILAFPFKHGITFHLIDQSSQGKDLISRLEVDPLSPSFARPTSEKNPETGIVNFCPLSELTDPESIYMKDGVYFIGVVINFLPNRPSTSLLANA